MSGFPKVVLAGVIVSAGIYLADQFDSRAAWLLAFFVLLVVAFGYPAFGTELIQLFGGEANNNLMPSPPNVVQPGNVVGPVPGSYA